MKNYVQSNPQSSIIFNKSEINFLLGSICSSNHSQEKAHVFLSLPLCQQVHPSNEVHQAPQGD